MHPFKIILDFFQIKKKLQVSEVRFQTVAQTATDSIVIADQNSTIIFCNKKAQLTFGYQEHEMVGQKLSMLMPAKYREAHYKGVNRFLSSRVPKLIGHVIEIEGLKKSGEIFPLELSLSFWNEDERVFFPG